MSEISNTGQNPLCAMPSVFPHLMIDLETMGSKSFASIVSIGAVEFNIKTGETGREFYRNIDLRSCQSLGLEIDADTVYWWLKQSKEAKESLFTECFSIQQAMVDFRNFCNKEYQIWGILQDST